MLDMSSSHFRSSNSWLLGRPRQNLIICVSLGDPCFRRRAVETLSVPNLQRLSMDLKPHCSQEQQRDHRPSAGCRAEPPPPTPGLGLPVNHAWLCHYPPTEVLHSPRSHVSHLWNGFPMASLQANRIAESDFRDCCPFGALVSVSVMWPQFTNGNKLIFIYNK